MKMNADSAKQTDVQLQSDVSDAGDRANGSFSSEESVLKRVRRSLQPIFNLRDLAFGPQRFPKVVLIGVVLIGVIITLLNPRFITFGNVSNMGQTAALIGIVAVSQTIVLVSGGLDLSLGAMAAACGLMLAVFLNAGITAPAAVTLAIACGVVLGAINGFIVGVIRLDSIIATLGTASVFYGGVLLYTRGVPLTYPRESLDLLTSKPFGFIVSFWVYLGVMLLAGLALHLTVWGWRVYTVGANPMAARGRGINVTRIRVSSYMVSGLFAGVAGVLLAVELGSAQPQGGRGWLLISVAAPIIGGVSVGGGIGTVFGCFLGIVLLTEISTGLILAGMTSYSRELALGIAILIAMATQSDRLKEARDHLRKRFLKARDF